MSEIIDQDMKDELTGRIVEEVLAVVEALQGEVDERDMDILRLAIFDALSVLTALSTAGLSADEAERVLRVFTRNVHAYHRDFAELPTDE